ncbi:MAG: PIN-like domain-containing protein [Caulobacteraceae bacterium]
MRLLVDNDLPPRLARALGIIFAPDHEIAALRDKFGRADIKDEEWIPALGDEGGWAVLSADLNIARKLPSRELFLRAGLVGFFFSPAMQKWPLSRQAARVLILWPQMVAHLRTTANGVFQMPTTGDKFRSIGR